VFNYNVDADGRLHIKIGGKPKGRTHRCFLFTRAAMQFWKFARFEPRQPKLPEAETLRRLRALFRIPPWAERGERFVFPGYADLWHFSCDHEELIQNELGNWLLTYLRVGNWRMMNPIVRLRQRSIAEKLFAAVNKGEIRAMYLAKFPHMNHVVLVFHAEQLAGGGMRFRAYDANYTGETARLDYVPKRNLFDFERRFYWPGGELRAFPVYDRPFH